MQVYAFINPSHERTRKDRIVKNQIVPREHLCYTTPLFALFIFQGVLRVDYILSQFFCHDSLHTSPGPPPKLKPGHWAGYTFLPRPPLPSPLSSGLWWEPGKTSRDVQIK